MNLKVFLYKSLSENVLLSGYELALPLVTCRIHYLDKILSAFNGVDLGAVSNSFSVYGNRNYGSRSDRISICPRDRYISRSITVCYSQDICLLYYLVNNNRIFSGRIARIRYSLENVFSGLAELDSRHVAYKGIAAGHLNVTGFVTLEGNICAVGI